MKTINLGSKKGGNVGEQGIVTLLVRMGNLGSQTKLKVIGGEDGKKPKKMVGDQSQLEGAIMGEIEKEKWILEIERLEKSIMNLVKKNAELEDKFARVTNSLVRVMYLATTTLYLMYNNKEGTNDAKDMETTPLLYGFLANDWL